DIDGEPATEVQTYSPKMRFRVGISRHPARVQTGYEAPLTIIVVDDQGKKISSGTIEAAVMERESFYVTKRDETGNINYLWEEGWMKKVSASLQITDGEATFQTGLHDAGSSMLAFTFVHETGRYTSQTQFKVGWGTRDEWMERRRDRDVFTSNEILLSTNKSEYSIGESVDVQFVTPRPVKKCLVTLERGEIFDFKVIDVQKAGGSYRFTIQEKFQPNVYVSVLAAAGRHGYPVYRSQADSDVPMVYFGYVDISVTSRTQKLQLEIAPEAAELKARPAEKQSISIKVTDQTGKGVRSEVAIGVVDEAVLALTRFQTPSLLTLTRFDIPLSVFSGDLRLDLVTQDLFRILSTKPLTGGDGGGAEMVASLRKDFRPVAYFNPAVVTDEKGQASVEFKLPDTTTAYRVYAVVCDKGSGFVSGQRTMVVTKEFFIEPSVPRFLINGDRTRFPVVLNNKTKEKGTFTVEAEASPGLKLGLDEITGAIEPWSSTVVKASAEVKSGTQLGKLLFKGKFTAAAGQYADAIERTLPIHSVYLPAYRSHVGDFAQRTTVQAKLPEALQSLDRESLSSEDFQATLSLSTTNWAKIAPGLKYLLVYPFGCVEQTSSGVIPLAGIRGLVAGGIIPGITAKQVDEFLGGGVERLLSM
ncbi:MAG: hypothetical protein FJY85_09430, partial [Deltaproteobacteria bacterium]|nr:hypothetical protein [Deltaproteobacteria bacterium]